MLKHLSIKNVVLIESLEIDFSDGLVVLSGETGAGKSILLDALGFLLGNRGDTSLIRNGADKLSVTGMFYIKQNNRIFEIAKEFDIEIGNEIIIKRSLSADGKGKILFNDQLITLKLLKELSQYLVEIHGQHENQGLLNPATHCSLLDEFAKSSLEAGETKQAFDDYVKVLKSLHDQEEKLAQARQDEENIKHWVQELEKTAPKKGEEENLRNRRTELMNAEKIIEKLNTAYAALNGSASVSEQISKARNAISRLNEIVNNKYSEIEQSLEDLLYGLNDVVNKIEAGSTDISLNQNEIDDIETRLYTLRSLAKKHQTEVEYLPEKLQELSNSLANLQKGEDCLTELKLKAEKLREDFINKAEKLSNKRKLAAKELDKSIMKELPPLKMEKAVFQTTISKKAEENWSDRGWDTVCFEVSTNPNTPLGALNKIASGGELSRFMLALKVNMAQQIDQETLIFDEIDAGIGGATAAAVGERLARLAQNVQVVVVTHSPQVAAYSNEHFKVEKTTENNITTTSLTKLTAKQKEEEIARMLAGEHITNEARAAARALLDNSATSTLF